MKFSKKIEYIRFSHLLLSALLVLSAGLLSNCGSDDDDDDKVVLTAQELSSRGWTKFKSVDYSGALKDFQDAIVLDGTYSDAWNGAGWAAGRLVNRLNDASSYFNSCLQRDDNKYDALGGWAFIEYQLGNWQSALDKAENLLNRRTGWRFVHQPSIDFNDLRLMTAAAHYNLADYQASLNVIVQYLNTNFDADINTPAGQRELLDEIERLRQIYG